MADKADIVRKLEEAKKIVDTDVSSIQAIHNVEHNYADLSRNLSHYITFVKFTPDAVFGNQFDNIDSSATNLSDYIKSQLPRIGTVDTTHLTSACAMGETGSSGVFSVIMGSQTQNPSTLPPQVTAELLRFQQEMLDTAKVKALSDSLKSRDPDLALRFDDAVHSYHRFLSSLLDGPSCANDLRNFYYKFRSFMWVKVASRQPNEKFTWGKAVDALAKGGPSSPEHSALVAKETTNQAVHSFLSNVAKDRTTFAPMHFDVCIVNLVDLSSACLSLMNI